MTADLNEAQQRAVEHGEGPLLVLAGAGTGKTRVLTHRVAHLIRVRHVPPGQVMAVTFTRKAAEEMKTRLAGLFGDGVDVRDARIGTFHALSASLLREAQQGRPMGKLVPEAAQLDILKEIMAERGLTGPAWHPLEVLRRISMAKGRVFAPDAPELAPDPAFATVYGAYQHRLKDRNLLDFDDLIGALIERWQTDRPTLAHHQRAFSYILVDEFQDVNDAQYQWLKLLASHRNLTVVGDSDQSIYAFRGSHVGVFQRFQEDFPEARLVRLEQNYRSSRNILAAAAAVIAHNQNPLTCRLWSDQAPGPRLRLARLADDTQEAAFVIGEIERLVGGSSHYQIYRGRGGETGEEARYGFADIAVLYRTHAQNRRLMDALSRAGVPFQVVGERAPFATPAADVLLSYLRFAADSSGVRDLQTIFNVPPRGLGEAAQQWLGAQIDKGVGPLEILWQGSKNLKLPVGHQAAMDRLRRIITSLQSLVAGRPLPAVLEAALVETGLRDYVDAEGRESARESCRWLHILAGSHDKGPALAALPAFLQDLAQWRAGDFFDPRADAVALMTLHAVKGLEFPVVFISGVDQDLVPLTRKDQGAAALEEERRLFYVAMTRARDLLLLTTARRRFLFGEVREAQTSPFIGEIPVDFVEEAPPSTGSRQKKGPKEKQLTLF
jgi:DNA helicase-2/ATP-dependent DNA helicase PcrA